MLLFMMKLSYIFLHATLRLPHSDTELQSSKDKISNNQLHKNIFGLLNEEDDLSDSATEDNNWKNFCSRSHGENKNFIKTSESNDDESIIEEYKEEITS